MARVYVSDQRDQNHQHFIRFLSKCNDLFVRGAQSTDHHYCNKYTDSGHVSISFSNVVNSSKFFSDHCSIGPKNIDELSEKSSCIAEKYLKDATAQSMDSCNSPKKILSNTEPIISMLNDEFDTRSTSNLREIADRKKCEIHFASDINDAQTVFFDGTANHVNNYFFYLLNLVVANSFFLFTVEF